MVDSAVQRLLAEQRPDGGWGAHPRAPSRTESTALCTLALRRAALDGGFDHEAVRTGLLSATAWLLGRQTQAGGWPIGDDVPGASWPTPLAALALADDPGAEEACARAGAWLLEVEGRGSPWWVRWLFRLAPERRPVALDPDLTGWPWVADTSSWVEPTAYALLALKRLRSALPGERTAHRIEEAERMLFDRVCPDGGWNYGNAVVFGESLWSYPDTTALALIALADRPDAPPVPAALATLRRLVDANDSLLSTGLSLLALRYHGAPSDELRTRVEARLASWDGGELRSLAWALVAVAEGDDPLGLARA